MGVDVGRTSRRAGEALGADAVIAVALDYEEVGDEMLMVAASGTAVKLE